MSNKTKTTLNDLNEYLFETLDRLTNESLTDEQLQREIERSEAVTTVATTIIQNGELQLKSLKLLHDSGVDISKQQLPLLEVVNG